MAGFLWRAPGYDPVRGQEGKSMKIVRNIGVFMLLAALGGMAAQASGGSGQAGAAPGDWRQAGAAYDKGDCATVLKLVAPRLAASARPDNAALRLEIGYDLAASCSARLGKPDDAYRYVKAATALESASDWAWRFRLALDLEKDRLEPAVATVEAMTEGRGRALNATPLRWLYSLSSKLKEQHQDGLRRRLLKILTDSGFSPDEVMSGVDGFRQSYAELLLADGDKAGATALVREIGAPWTVTEMSFDTRFAGILPADLDLRAVVERDLAKARDIMRTHPELLAPVIAVAQDLRQLDRPQEALDVLDIVRNTIGSDGGSGKGFTDADEQMNWWWDGLARTYAMLGRYDDMVIALQTGANKKEGEAANVSQIINLAQMQTRFGKPREALKTLAVFDTREERSMSPYGAMEMRFARGCANVKAGRKDAVAADLAYLKAHDSDHSEALSNMLLCMDDLDGAAASIIQRLSDPERRAFTLRQISDYDTPPVAVPPDPLLVALAKVKARPDVIAAIARAGRTQRIHLQPSEM
jgi:hypothetical protein